MQSVLKYVKGKPITWLLLAIPLALLAEYFHWGDLTVLLLSSLAVIPLAGYILSLIHI